jgi:hypothetical protein
MFLLISVFAGFSEPNRNWAVSLRRASQAYAGAISAENSETADILEIPVYERYAESLDAAGASDETEYISSHDYVMTNIYANSPMSEYIALQLVNRSEEFSLKDFPEAADIPALLDALTEAYYQNNANIGGVELNQIMCDFNTLTLQIPYALSADEQRLLQEDIAIEAGSVLSRITTLGMSDYQKAEAINNYLCESSVYDIDAKADLLNLPSGKIISDTYKYSQTAYGVLINHRGVCQSYAEAFKVLANRAGLSSIVVTGVLNGTGPHAWNRVYADGRWFTLDATNNGVTGDTNKFFNLSAEAAAEYFTEDDRYILDSALGLFR